MNVLLIPILLLCLALSAGCTAPGTASPAAATTPNLTGNWTGSPQGFIEGIGYIGSSDTIGLQVTGQHGRIFTGNMSIIEANGSVTTRGVAGALSRDGKSFTLVQSDTGYDLGTVVSDDEIEMVYVSDADPATVVIDSFKRSA